MRCAVRRGTACVERCGRDVVETGAVHDGADGRVGDALWGTVVLVVVIVIATVKKKETKGIRGETNTFCGFFEKVFALPLPPHFW